MTDTASDLQREIDAYRRRLIAMDRQASQVLSAAYAETLNALQPRLDALTAQINARIAAGEPFSPSWLFQQDRYRELIRQTNVLMAQYGAATATVTSSAQAAAIRASLAEAGRELAAVSGGAGETLSLAAQWAAIPDSSVQNMVGALQEQTPLGQLFAGFGPDAVRDVNRALTTGMALGLGARDIARDVQLALGITRARAETIVRTETMRAANAALMTAFEESGVVTGWRWSASLSARTCAACLSRHGTVYPLRTPMERHVNCRCVASPVVAGADDWESGEAWLRRQPLSVQQQVLGVEGGSLFNAGQLRLEDFQKRTTSQQWGASVTDGGVSWAKRQAAIREESGVRSPSLSSVFSEITGAEHFQSASLQLRSMWTDTVLRVAQDAAIRTGTRTDSLSFFRGGRTGDVAQARARAPGKHVLGINVESEFWTLSEADRITKMGRGYIVNPSNEGAIYHEYGHIHQYDVSGPSKAFRYLNDDELDAASTVSRYGMTNEGEFMAEVYSSLMTTGNDAYGKPLTEEAIALYQRLGGKIPEGKT